MMAMAPPSSAAASHFVPSSGNPVQQFASSSPQTGLSAPVAATAQSALLAPVKLNFMSSAAAADTHNGNGCFDDDVDNKVSNSV